MRWSQLKAQEFGTYLLKLRKSKKLSIRQLDLYSGVSHSYISQLERGLRGVPSPEILSKLSKPLGVDYEELMLAAGYMTQSADKSDNAELDFDVGDPGTPEREEFTKIFLKDFNELSEEAQKQIHELIKTWKGN